jgi:hypothetical protein
MKGALFMLVKKERPLKSFVIRHLGSSVQIETSNMLPESLDAILTTVFHELRKRRPDKLDRIMQLMKFFYDRTLREEAAKLAKKEGRKLPVFEGPEPDTFDFWRELMETPPQGVGEGGLSQW